MRAQYGVMEVLVADVRKGRGEYPLASTSCNAQLLIGLGGASSLALRLCAAGGNLHGVAELMSCALAA